MCIRYIHVHICLYSSCTPTGLQCQQQFPAMCPTTEAVLIILLHLNSLRDKAIIFTPQEPVQLERFLLGSL